MKQGKTRIGGARRGYRVQTRISIRGALPTDTEALRGMFSRSSSESIYRRFHLPYREVPGWMLDVMLTADPRDKLALVAVAHGRIVGHAMYVGLGAEDEAEMAIIVEDSWQSMGVGKLLLSDLAWRARNRGITAFVGEVLGTNQSMLGLAGMFPEMGYTIDDGVCRVRMPLGAQGTEASTAHTQDRAA